MKRSLLAVSILIFLFLPKLWAQSNQIYNNGQTTTAVDFQGTGCVYNWVNNTPAIGLPASGTGNIASFTAINTGNTPVTATITATPAAGYAYIANNATIGNNITADETVSVINTSTGKFVSNITVGASPNGVAVSPDGSMVYVTNDNSDNVSVINTATNTVVATIPVGTNPRAVSVSPDGSQVYVANVNSNNVSVINTATNTVSALIVVGTTPQMGPIDLMVSPDGTKVYGDYGGGATGGYLFIISTSTNLVTSTIPLPTGELGYLTISPDGSTVYVVNEGGNSVYEISTATQSITGIINVDNSPVGITISPDGTRLYVTNSGSNSVSVINPATNSVIATVPVGLSPEAISVTPDGSQVYVENTFSNTVSVISTTTYIVINKITVGAGPEGFGNFIMGSTSCTGTPVTFTITVNAAAPPPVVIAGTVTGTILACAGTASVSPQVQQFTVSGSNLTADITATAPNGFEVSLNAGSGYGPSVTLTQSGGTVNSTVIYVRTSATAATGDLTDNVTLASAGATSQSVAVQGTVNALPTVNAVSPQNYINGATTNAINFTGTGNTFNWVNNTPGIGLPANGTGNIASFTAVNTGSSPVVATITATPVSAGGTNCTGEPITFTITVINPVITATGTLPSLTTTYGTPSASTTFDVSATSLTAGILVTPPPGFEVSSDDATFSSTVTVGATGTLATTQVYIRLAAATPVGNYSGPIKLSSPGASTVTFDMPISSVTPALLTIIADYKTKDFGTVNPVLTASYIGFVNNETPDQLTTLPVLTTTAVTTSPVGQYLITASGASSPNYTISYIPGILIVVLTENEFVIPNTFTPNGDGINDTWDIKYLSSFQNCLVDIFNRYGQKVFTSIGYGIPWNGTYKGTALPAGTYYYIINLRNGQKILSGFVAIIR